MFCTAFIFHKVASCSSTEPKNCFCYVGTSISNNSAMGNNHFPLPIEHIYWAKQDTSACSYLFKTRSREQAKATGKIHVGQYLYFFIQYQFLPFHLFLLLFFLLQNNIHSMNFCYSVNDINSQIAFWKFSFLKKIKSSLFRKRKQSLLWTAPVGCLILTVNF